MDINKLTIGEARDIARMFCGDEASIPAIPQQNIAFPFKIGQAYHIRTVTHYWTGRLVSATATELVLSDAAWIASTGRFADMFTDGPDEIEPVDGLVIIGRGAVVDAQEWELALPRKQK